MKHVLILLLTLLSLTSFAQDGIKTDSITSAQNGIEIDIAPDAAISIAHARKARLR